MITPYLQSITECGMIGVYQPVRTCGTRFFYARIQSHIFSDWQYSAASIGLLCGQRVGVYLVGTLLMDAASSRLNCIKRKRYRPMTDPDSITITIPIRELRRLLAELNTKRAVTACPTIVALILDVSMPPRLGVRGWIDGLAKRRRQ